MRKTLFTTGLLAAAVLATACYPHRLDSVDYDVVATVFDSSANFNAGTYYLLNTVVHLVPPGESDNIGRGADAAALAAVRANMTARGYTEGTDSLTVDLKLAAAATTTDYQVYYYDYYCGFYWYYCPPYWGSYSYTLGTLLVSMKDRRVPTGAEAMWLGIGNGLLNGTPSASRVTDAINSMFQQSPYISAN